MRAHGCASTEVGSGAGSPPPWDEVLAAICAGVTRPPLTTNVAPVTHPGPHACTAGESPRGFSAEGAALSYYPDCLGCLATMSAFLVKGADCNDDSGRRVSAYEWLATYVDEFNPIRITVERELARRSA